MKKIFEMYGSEYTVENCIAEWNNELQEVLKVSTTLESGEVSEMYVFGYRMPETHEDFEDMCEDQVAWEPVYNYS